MESHRLDIRIGIAEPEYSTDNLGNSYRSGYTDRGSIWAERVKRRFKDEQIASETLDGSAAEYNIRWEQRVRTGWRVTDPEGVEYTVTEVEDNRRKGLRTLRCERRLG